MESKNYSISEVELDPIEAKEIMSNFIDAQIQSYKIKSLQDWERKHYTESKWDGEIEKLINLKNYLDEEFEKMKEGTDLLKINFSLELENVSQHSVANLS